MSISVVAEKLGDLVHDDWVDVVDTQGSKVRLYRDYADGKHRVIMSSAMKDMFFHGQVSDRFNENYCQMIVDTMADRLMVTGIKADSDEATTWGDEVRRDNRFDQLMIEVHEATLRDGDGFVMADFDNTTDRVRLVFEPAYNGETGMVAVYDRMNRHMLCAVKLWKEAGSDSTLFNIYYADKIERYDGEGNLRGEADAWKVEAGIPVVHFKNRSRSTKANGKSELADGIPLQDAINRNLVSMTMTGELTAFMIRYIIGADLDDDKITPGMWIKIPGPVTSDQRVDLGVLPAGGIMPFIEQGTYLEDRLGFITRTPLPQHMGGANASGESQKEREKPLLAKVKRFMVYGGNAWEDVMGMVHRMQMAFGSKHPPIATQWDCQWADAEVRNDTVVIDNALKVRELVGERETLRQVGKVYKWNEDKVAAVLAEKQAEVSNQLGQLALPGFGSL